MPWLKVSDASAMHPIALAAMEAEDADERLVNELFGYVARCAVMSAQHEQDYVVTLATARVTAGGDARFKVLAAAAERAGYWTRTTVKDASGAERPAFRLVEEKDLFHMLLKKERAWETQRRADVANPELTVPVRLRDGDGCRWCGKSVAWRDRKSGRGATYDHVKPGQGAASPEDLVVACRACNGARKDEENTSFSRTLMAPPFRPLYGPDTLAFLAEHDVVPEQQDTATAAERQSQRETAPTPTTAAPATAAGSTARTATAAPRQGVRETADGQERRRGAQVRDVDGQAADAAAAHAQREADARRAEAERERRLDAWLADHGISVAPAPATALSPLDVEEADWAPSEGDAGPPGGPDLQIPADRQAEGSGFPGTGRDGSGREGPGLDVSGTGGARDGSGLDGGSAGSGRRRRRRGRRGGRGRGGEG
ncbi:HNH endonuclease [Micrococcus luteus]|nr:HNH endonuclease [Micrococcus luteus]